MEFDNNIIRIDKYLRLIGMTIDKDDSQRTVYQRLVYHWKCCIHLFFFNLSILGQTLWLITGMATGESLTNFTYLMPCLTTCILGNCKIISLILHAHRVNDVIDTLKQLYITIDLHDDVERKWLKYLANVNKLLLFLLSTGLAAFGIGPFVISISHYYGTGDIRLFLPFLVWYPFDEFDIRFWPFVYLQQMSSAWVAIFSVYGPDSFFFTSCTFIYINFVHLQRDIDNIVRESSQGLLHGNSFKKGFVKLVDRHRQLIRCVQLLNSTYSISTLFNVVTSSLIICATGFNLMVFKNYVLMAPFFAFLFFGLLQVFFYCYYGDCVMRSSVDIGNAIYNSRWYEVGKAERRILFIVLLRSQRPCKFRAYLFTDIHLGTFMRILSTSWSYFALLNQMYRK